MTSLHVFVRRKWREKKGENARFMTVRTSESHPRVDTQVVVDWNNPGEVLDAAVSMNLIGPSANQSDHCGAGRNF